MMDLIDAVTSDLPEKTEEEINKRIIEKGITEDQAIESLTDDILEIYRNE